MIAGLIALAVAGFATFVIGALIWMPVETMARREWAVPVMLVLRLIIFAIVFVVVFREMRGKLTDEP